MKLHALLAAALLAFQVSDAEVPQQLNYQGCVAVSGVNFTGTGENDWLEVAGAAGQRAYFGADAKWDAEFGIAAHRDLSLVGPRTTFETMTLGDAMTLRAVGGPVTIGQP
jgi:hypothetical protein